MLTHAINRAFETAILVSGDNDYLETVRAVKNMGLRVEIVSFRNSLSQELAAESSAPVVYFDDIRANIELPTPDREADQLVEREQTVSSSARYPLDRDNIGDLSGWFDSKPVGKHLLTAFIDNVLDRVAVQLCITRQIGHAVKRDSKLVRPPCSRRL